MVPSAVCPPTGGVTTVINDVHYWVPPKQTTFQEGNDLCQENGMTLASVTTSAKVNQVLQAASGPGSYWVGIYNPNHDWLECQNEGCQSRLFTVYGLVLNYYGLNVPIVVKKNYKCLELSQNSSLLSQDCQALLQPICEVDCSPKDPCNQPHPDMYPLHGRWVLNFLITNNNGKSFDDIKATCQSQNSQVTFIKEVRDLWNPDWLAKHKGGPHNEIYIGLDPSSLPKACTEREWIDTCEGLRWLDGTPYDRNVVSWGVETNGLASVGCFIVTNSSTGRKYIKGVNDCQVQRSSSCVSDCMYTRCPISRDIENGNSDRDRYRHVQKDKIRFV
ncbi:hypothetical protein TCAL_11385 [Tigriopus californicus]|uniref:C-type lectin domain-containing protein n=1 Tax=Tigriopus californicus TaxID=6832 RepID=A0A553PHR6_TIGCA|nr:hypothetical protein TCAL_11385 [Tigriopus californicus]|eukprot:TCALIF_11385-PA protein Name:"Protein of unknown function" AED:0.39 eAED:0.39 QI:0/0.5/0/0.66/1/1/3/0/330